MNVIVESFYNPHMALNEKKVDAIVTVTTTGDNSLTAISSEEKAVVFVIDMSGSMQGEKAAQAKSALRRCVKLLDENCYFSIIAFNHRSNVIVPMVLAIEDAKSSADYQIKQLDAGGGTGMSEALLTALKQFKSLQNKEKKTINFVQFLTDGQNDSADRSDLIKALNQCEGEFQCDCWGIGTDWKPDELRKISSQLLGSADAVPDPETLETHFNVSLSKILSKGISDVRLRLQMPRSSKILTIKQMSPEILDLSNLARKVDERNTDFPLGSWGAETRDYHIVFETEPQDEGEEMLVCRPKIVLGNDENIVDGQRIVAAWTQDESLTARINAQVAHYTGQEELAASIRGGLEAKSRGDMDQATALLGRAAKLAIQSGNDEVTMRLKKVVDIVDADQGTVRLKSGAGKGADLELDMGGTRTIRRRPQQS